MTIDHEYPGTAVERMLAARARVFKLTHEDLDGSWEDVRTQYQGDSSTSSKCNQGLCGDAEEPVVWTGQLAHHSVLCSGGSSATNTTFERPWLE